MAKVLVGAIAIALLALAFVLCARVVIATLRVLVPSAIALTGIALVIAGTTGNDATPIFWISGGFLIVVGVRMLKGSKKPRPKRPVDAPDHAITGTKYNERPSTSVPIDYVADAASLRGAGQPSLFRSRDQMEQRHLNHAWALLKKYAPDSRIAEFEQDCGRYLKDYPQLPMDADHARLASEISGDVPTLLARYLALAASGVDDAERHSALETVVARVEALSAEARRALKPEIERRRTEFKFAVERPYRAKSDGPTFSD